jgi:hypothetical protein
MAEGVAVADAAQCNVSIFTLKTTKQLIYFEFSSERPPKINKNFVFWQIIH